MDMNLYKNFGSLLETMAERSPNLGHDADRDSKGEETTSRKEAGSRPSLLLKSESEDSGVEETPVTPQESEKSFPLARDSNVTDGLVPSSPPSASSPLKSTVTQENLHRLQDRVEQALQRTQRLSHGPQRGTNPGPKRLPRHSINPKLELLYRLQEHDPIEGGREAEALVQSEHMEPWNSPELQGLSPGLTYLEHMCRLLEEIARLWERNRELTAERDWAQKQLRDRGTQDPMSRQCLCCAVKAANQEPDAKQNGDAISQSASESKPIPLVFRRRSMSDSQTLEKRGGQKKRQQVHYGSTRLLVDVEAGQNGNGHPDIRMKTSTSTTKDTTDESCEMPVMTQESSPVERKTKQRFAQLFKRRSKNKSMR